MNTKRKGEKGKGIIGITLAAIMVMSIFAAMVTPVAAIEYEIGKSTLTGPGGTVDNSLQYKRGDTVYYRLSFKPTSEACTLTSAKDVFPDVTEEDLINGNLPLAKDELVTWETNWTIPMDWPDDTITNYLVIDGLDGDGVPFEATAPKTSLISPEEPPEFNITWEQICCKNISFDGSASYAPNGFKNHTWNFGDGTTITEDGAPSVITHLYSHCGIEEVNLSGYDNDGNFNSTPKGIYIDCGPTASAKATPVCYEANGTQITFDGSASQGDKFNPFPRPITWWKWTYSDGGSGTSDDAVNTSREVNATLTATLEVSDGCCNDTTNVTVNPCSKCKLRIYGTFNNGPGDLTAIDPVTGLRPENSPYSDPVGPFHPQHPQAPRKDFITFNPAIMDHNQGYPELDFVECGAGTAVQVPQEKVFKRMWYEKEWFKDHDRDGCWDVVIDKLNKKTGKYEYEQTMCLRDWNAIPEWIKVERGLRIREWNNDPTINDSNVDIYGPAINQEFAYMFVDDEWMPQMIAAGSEVLIPMAHEPTNAYRGLNSFDADGDGVRDALRVESEQTLGFNIDQDGRRREPMDRDGIELSGDETVVLVLGDKYMSQGSSIQLFDHVVTLKDVFNPGGGILPGQARFDVCDNEGGGSQRCTENVMMMPGQIRFFYRAKPGSPAERETFYLRLIGVDVTNNAATVELGRMFGQTYANIGANPFWSQKAFIVDEVFYNVVAIKAVDNCIKYIVFRQKLPKLPIKLYGKHLKVWDIGEVLPEMSPFNMDHEVCVDVQAAPPWTRPRSQQDKIGPKEPRPPLEITYTKEAKERRYKGELKEIYNETDLPHYPYHIEYWDLEWFHTKPWQYTEFRLPAGDKYLVTLSWFAPESEITLWNGDYKKPVANYTGERLKFWYQDCSGPLYIDANKSSIRIFGTFGEGPGDLRVRDRITGLRPENPPYTDPVGPFYPQNEQAPRKDFMTFNPAIMDHNQGYPELDFVECNWHPSAVQTPQEKVFKRMWYEKEWFKDHDRDGCWDVVIDKYNKVTKKYEFNRTICLRDWNAIPEWIKVTEGLKIREWNNDVRINDSNVDIYGPAIKQEFAYMFLDDERMPIMIGAGSDVLIPMAHDPANAYRGLNSFDADGDGERDALRVESEQTLRLDIDRNGRREPMNPLGTELNGEESVVLVLGNKLMTKGGSIQLFDHVVTLRDVFDAGGVIGGQARFDVCDNEGGGSQRCTNNVMMDPAWNNIEFFYRAKPGSLAERETFYLRIIAVDIGEGRAIVEVGRMFGQTYANIGANPFWSQKAFMVDGVFYNVVAIKAVDNCIKYIVFRQKLPKMPIKLYGKHLKVWDVGETLPEMTPFNEEHQILIDVQPTWTRPYSQQDKIGPKKTGIPPLNITYVEEGHEKRFKGELKEIYNESHIPGQIPDEWWNLEWFHTKPQQYTAFVMPEGHGLYMMTLAWFAPQAEITIWDHDPDGPVGSYTGERVKFWYDPADNRDIYINRVGEDHEIPPAWMSNMVLYYDMASHGGNGDGIIDLDEVINAIMDYLTDMYPFGPTGPGAPFDKDGLIDYILDYLAQP